MPKPPREVDGFTALPLLIPKTKAYPKTTTHYLFLKPHDPKIPDEDAPRSLFLVNIPVCTTAQDLKSLLTARLEGGRIEKVRFSEEEAPTGRNTAGAGQVTKLSRKRKRMTTEEIEAGLDKMLLPKPFDSEIHSSGATAIVVFVDRPSMQLSWKAARRCARQGEAIPFYNEPSSEPSPAVLGLSRYQRHHHDLLFPSRTSLLRSVSAYMTAYATLETSRARESARKRAEPDEDGFVTVTRGSKGVARMDEAKEVAERMKDKEKERVGEMGDFYRFQTRERRKREMEGVVRKFEEDKLRVEEMRKKRKAAAEG